MAKIVPQGYADIKQYDEFDDYTKMLDFLTNIGNTYREVKKEHETSQIQAMTLAGSLIAGANSPEEIEFAKNSIDSVINPNYISTNPKYNILKETLDFSADDRTDKINQISRQTGIFASLLTSSDNEFGTPIMDMGGEQLKTYYDNLVGQEGWILGLGKEREKLLQYTDLIEATYAGKNPNYQIKYTDNNGTEQKMSLREAQRLMVKYDSQMEALILGALDDGVLSKQEANTIASLTGEKGYGMDKFMAVRGEKLALFQDMYNRGTSGINTVLNKMMQMIKQSDSATTGLDYIDPQHMDAVKGFSQSEFLDAHYPVGSLEGLGPEERFQKVFGDITSGKIDKNQLHLLIGAVGSESGDLRVMAEQGLRAWGGQNYFEFKVTPGEDEDSVSKYLKEKKMLEKEEEEAKKFTLQDSTQIGNITSIIKKYENVPDSLKNINNAYAIKFGPRAERFGATDSGIEASDGGTFASWQDAESMELGAQKVIEEMLLEDADGDVKQFISNYIGQPIDSPEVETRYNEIMAAIEEPAAEPVEEPAAEPVEEPAAEPVEEPAAGEIVETPSFIVKDGEVTKKPERDDLDSEDPSGILNFVNEYKSEIVVGTGAAAYATRLPKVQKVTNNAINYLKDVINLPEDTILDMFQDYEVKNIAKNLQFNVTKLDNFRNNLPPGVTIEDLKLGDPKNPKFQTYKKLLKDYKNSMDAGVAKLKSLYPDVPEKALMQMMKNSKKWNLYRMKTQVANIIKQTYRTPKDLLRVLTTSGWKVGPLDGAIWGWYAGEKLGLDWKGQVVTTGAGFWTTKKILAGIAKRKGWTEAIRNPVLQSKIGKYLINKAPWIALKLGLKGAVGVGAQAFPVAGQIAGGAMLLWTVNDIKNLIQDFPEIKEYLVEYLEGYYDDGVDRSGDRFQSDIIALDSLSASIDGQSMMSIARKKPDQIFEVKGKFYRYDLKEGKLIDANPGSAHGQPIN